MTVTTSNLAMGPGDLYTGVFGATEPASTAVGLTDAPGVGWTSVGGTLGGLTMTVSQEYKALEVDQLIEVPERRVTKREVSVSTSLAEVTLANLALALGSGTTTSVTDADQDVFTPDSSNSATSPEYKALIFDGVGGGGLRRRCIIRKVLSTDNVEIASSKDTQQAYKVTFSSHYVSSSIPSYKIIQATAPVVAP